MSVRLRRALVLSVVTVAAFLGTTLTTTVKAVSTSLVIHEFRTRGPNGAFDEFIEIRNVSGGSINLSGWNVIGSNGSGLQDVRANLHNVTLAAGCSWLLGNSQPAGYTGPVDQTYAVGITDDGGRRSMSATPIATGERSVG
jgi:Lamin Tail Domain